ncbi:hypothetical protein [Actinacidiphila sp. bgisy160]|uniref:hypothetical protein n=1 Tax=Actinacidiphila sp. bgisy160 TaxID=3413796 RepID=UPI003D72C361
MSVTGVWVVGAVPDDEARARARALSGHTSPHATGEEELLPAGGAGQRFLADAPAVLRFAELVHCATAAEDDQPTLTLQDELMDLMPRTGGDGPFAVAARKASPVAALVYALGPGATALLPGRFGEFLLTHDEVVAALPRVERALDVRHPAGGGPRPRGRLDARRGRRGLRRRGTARRALARAPSRRPVRSRRRRVQPLVLSRAAIR